MATPLQTSLALLAAAMRTSDFWWAVSRHSVPVIGVAAFTWSPVNVAVFHVLESWLFLSTHLTLETTLDERASAASMWEALRKIAWLYMVAPPCRPRQALVIASAACRSGCCWSCSPSRRSRRRTPTH